MKTAILLITLSLTGTLMVVAHKKTNGTVYIEHPAIMVTDNFVKDFAQGNTQNLADYLSDDFTWYNGTTGEKADKAQFLKTLLPTSQFDYFSMTPFPGSYPDAIEYRKDNRDGYTSVFAWYMLKGVHKTTGVKIDTPAHIEYSLTKDNKIRRIIEYVNAQVFQEIGSSHVNRTNGKIYNHHENINTVRQMVYALEKGDLDKNLSYYDDSARFTDINEEWGKFHGKKEENANQLNFLKTYEIKSIDMVGYPDYLEYELENGRSVLSWWKLNLVRKSDKKTIVLPLHLNDEFDKEGKIITEIAYYSEPLLNKK